MADKDKPLRVSADDERKARSAGVWSGASPRARVLGGLVRDRLRAGTLAALVRMANAEHEGDDATVFREALEVRRLAVLLVQNIDENGV